MRTVVVDDEPLAREGLRLMLASHADVAVVGEAGNGSDALALVSELRPDLLLVDVQMPEISGLEMAAELPADLSPALVFVTAHDVYALRAFEVHALDYVLKPVDDDRLRVALDRARTRLAQLGAWQQREQIRGALATFKSDASGSWPADRLVIRDGDRVVFLEADQIDWIEAADYYVEIHVGPTAYLHRETMQHLALALDPERFVRIHRSRLVNRGRIRVLRTRGRGHLTVILADGTELRVARSCRAMLRPPR